MKKVRTIVYENVDDRVYDTIRENYTREVISEQFDALYLTVSRVFMNQIRLPVDHELYKTL